MSSGSCWYSNTGNKYHIVIEEGKSVKCYYIALTKLFWDQKYMLFNLTSLLQYYHVLAVMSIENNINITVNAY